MDYSYLAELAVAARANAYSPYSGFRVGAALLAADGTVYTGCNVENAAYSPACCAERAAIFKAVSEGQRAFTAIAVAGGFDGEEPAYCYPCGVCRQVMREFAGGDFQVIVVKTPEDFKAHTLGELLPHAFGPENLERRGE